MRSTARIALTVLLWFYLTLLGVWWLLHLIYGDQIWWLALLNSFLPFFFAPLLFFLPLELFVRQPRYQWGLLLPALLFVVNYGQLFLPNFPPSYRTDPPPFSVMTFNIWSGSHLLPTGEVIAHNGYPAIVALQEMTGAGERLVRRAVGDHYPYMFFDRTADGRGLATLSQYPLTPVRGDLLIDLNCRVFRVTVDPAHNFMLYNCRPRSSNLANFFNDGQPLPAQVNDSFQLRKLLSQRLVAQIQASRLPTLLIGDFNTTDQSESYAILQQTLQDAHRQAGWGFGHTFPAEQLFWHGIPILGHQVRIDMVWYTNDFVALAAVVSALHGESDHSPVVAQLAWRE